MTRIIWSLPVFFMAMCVLSCSGGNGTGSDTFVPDQLKVSGNPNIGGESPASPADPGGFILIDGVLKSTSGVSLTGLKVTVQVYGRTNDLLGSGEGACVPADILAGASCRFTVRAVLQDTAYVASSRIDIQPLSDQGPGTTLSLPVLWQ